MKGEACAHSVSPLTSDVFGELLFGECDRLKVGVPSQFLEALESIRVDLAVSGGQDVDFVLVDAGLFGRLTSDSEYIRSNEEHGSIRDLNLVHEL